MCLACAVRAFARFGVGLDTFALAVGGKAVGFVEVVVVDIEFRKGSGDIGTVVSGAVGSCRGDYIAEDGDYLVGSFGVAVVVAAVAL
jgi:hypothetical protein